MNRRTRFLLILAIVALCAIGLIFGKADAATPPATRYAFDVAATATNSAPCEVSIVQAPYALAYSGEPCSYALSRRFAGWAEFPAACRLFMSAMLGRALERVPATCLSHELFLLNHPEYLSRRYG